MTSTHRSLPRALRRPRPLALPVPMGAYPTGETPEPVEGELLLPDPIEGAVAETVDDPHGVKATRYAWGVALVCACLDWEAVVTGPSSARWAQRQYREHLAAVGAPVPE